MIERPIIPDEVAGTPAPPILSVVMPNYNHAAVLPRSVGAFLAQTIPLEIIIVDDSSTDNSVAIIEDLRTKHPQIRLIRRKENGGPSKAIAEGLAAAGGTFVTFSAADDLVDATFGERSIEVLQQHPSAALSFLDPSILDEATGKTYSISLALADRPTYFSPQQIEELFRRNSFTISSNTVVYRREEIAAIGGFREDLGLHCDWMANLVLTFRRGACYRPEALAHFLVDPDGWGSTSARNTAEQKRLLFACLDALNQDYGDVESTFRRSALLPELHLRTLWWLLGDPRGRRYLTPRLVARLIQREAWAILRPLTPLGVRRWMRRLAATSARARSDA